tara:strand:- start:2649 stop:3581 length:933 start_codon:yes stop_codon:yes gene_type:complete
MKALLFPGQGSQIVGMGSDFYNEFNEVKEIFEMADNVLKFKISKIILEGPENELKLTQNTQPAIMTVSYAIFSVLKKHFNLDLKSFKFLAGHSLGEYSALVCSNSLRFEDALYLLYERGKAMQESVPVGQGAMLAVLGCNLEEINNCLDKINTTGVCEIANDNANGQIIMSGNIKKINDLQYQLKTVKKKSILLPVSAPFHCTLMKSASEVMKDKIMKIVFKNPANEIVSNVTATSERAPEVIKRLLVEQIYSKVRWRESILFMKNNGVNEFFEIGPGKVLSGLIKRIMKEAKSFNINTIDDAKKFSNEL